MATSNQNLEGIFVWADSFCPSLICLSWIFWLYVHRRLSQIIPYYFLPPSCWEIHSTKIQAYKRILRSRTARSGEISSSAAAHAPSSTEDLEKYFVTSRANSTAFLHAVIVTPMAFAVAWVVIEAGLAELNAREAAFHYVSHGSNISALLTRARLFLWDWGGTFAFWNKRSFLLDCVAYTMGGYFLWDMWECWHHRKYHQSEYFVHALLSLWAMVSYLIAQGSRMTGIVRRCARNHLPKVLEAACIPLSLHGLVAFLCASEVSTPLLHVRWFLLQTGAGNTTTFQLVNLATALVFICYRIIVVPGLVLSHAAIEWLSGSPNLPGTSQTQVLTTAVAVSLWLLLNLFWTAKFARTLYVHSAHAKSNDVQYRRSTDGKQKVM